MIHQELDGDTSWGGTLRGAIKEIEGVSNLGMCRAPHTSSRDKACLNTLIVEFTDTKGKDRPVTTPTLATVSLSINRLSFHVDQNISRGHPPDTNKVNGYGATECLLEPRGENFVTCLSRRIQFVCKGDLLRVIFGEQANLHSQPSWY
jgi:hypothetical protein